MTTEIDMAKNGEFLREYGKQYFVVAAEALNIGRVKWDMVPIGTNGQKNITFYLKTEQMLALCHEILSGVFAKKIAADNNAYPSAYKYVTGEDGCLRLNIGGGKMGCRIQLQDAKNKINYTMAVSMEAINTMARKYMLCSGMTPIAPKSYYSSVVAAFEEGRTERSKFRQPNLKDLGDVVEPDSVINDSAESGEIEEHTQTKSDVTASNSDHTSESSGAQNAEQPAIEDNFTLRIHGTKSLKKGLYAFDGVDGNGEKITLMFRKEDAENAKWFTKFEDAAAQAETKLSIFGERKRNYILYKGPVKK